MRLFSTLFKLLISALIACFAAQLWLAQVSWLVLSLALLGPLLILGGLLRCPLGFWQALRHTVAEFDVRLLGLLIGGNGLMIPLINLLQVGTTQEKSFFALISVLLLTSVLTLVLLIFACIEFVIYHEDYA